METEEITKLVDGIYKNILDKFNPGARQMINAGKAYLKALHGAAAASRMYVDAITKLARQSQQGTWGGSADIGSALMQIVEVYKEIQSQQMNILKAFYVDLLVPLETNLEKDTKVVQSEQKRFLQQHKQRSETYTKAAATIKKQRKKQRNAAKTGIAMDKELKSMQILEEERSKLDAFCEQSLKNAMTQERRRYGFVLERQCSLAKHYLAYHNAGHTLYQNHLDDWQEVAKTREFLPSSVENMFANKLTNVSFWAEEGSGGSPKMDDDRASVNSQLRKTKSMDASCLDMRNMNELSSPPHHPLARAKSDFNLTASTQSLTQEISSSPGRRPKSMAVADTGNWDTPLARAMYAYLSSGENQLSFLEGDIIALMGERNKGWQFGENLRTQSSGWFPLAYTEPFIDDSATTASSPTHKRGMGGGGSGADLDGISPGGGGVGGSPSPGNNSKSRPAPFTRFGDTLALRNHPKVGQMAGQVDAGGHQAGAAGGVVSGFSVGGPPEVPAPTVPRKAPSATVANTGGVGRLLHGHTHPLMVAQGGGGGGGPATASSGVATVTRHQPPANASLHSSNDSGFSNDPPPAPEIDYSDDDTARNTIDKNRRNRVIAAKRHDPKRGDSTVRGWLSESMDEWYHQQEVDDLPGGPNKTMSRSASHLATLGRKNDPSEMKLREVQRQLKAIEIDKKVKRTKSLWKFRRNGGGDEIIEGMAMWKHRSLIDLSNGVERTPRPDKKLLTLPPQQRDPDEDTIVDGGGTLNHRRNDTCCSEDSTDSESCIVVDDHRKRAEAIMGHSAEVSSVSILPRTRLIHNGKSQQDKARRSRPTPMANNWGGYNSWDDVKN